MIKLINLLKEYLQEDATLSKLEKEFENAYFAWIKDKKNIRAKRTYDNAAKELSKYEKSLKLTASNIPELKKIFKKFGLNSVTYQSSSVRGFNRAERETYEFPDKNNPKIIWLHTTQSKIKNIIDAMNASGFDIQQHSGETITLN
jgi:hypothetical protein